MSRRLRTSLLMGTLGAFAYLLTTVTGLAKGHLQPLNVLEVAASTFLGFTVLVLGVLVVRDKLAEDGEEA